MRQWQKIALSAYLFLLGIGAIVLIIVIFPEITQDGSNGTKLSFPEIIKGVKLLEQRGLILLAFSAGIAGSFIHAAQSLSSYIGNVRTKPSWIIWYVMRPWIGGGARLCDLLCIPLGPGRRQ